MTAMTKSTVKCRVVCAALPLLIGALVLALPGCKNKRGAGAAAPSASASAAAAKYGTGPCGTYAQKVCEKIGAESTACQTIGAAVDLLPPAACVAGMKDIDYTAKAVTKQHKICDDLVEVLCAAVGPKSQTCKMVTTQTKQFTPERCKTLMQHKAEVITELQGMEKANQPIPPEQQAALMRDAASAFGPDGAKVQIVEFSDFQCPYCARAADVVRLIKEKYGDRVRFVFRQFPLGMHPQARGAAEAALAAGSQGKFWEYHDVLFKNQQQLAPANLEEHAKKLGLNVAAFKKSMDEHKFGPAVEADMKLGQDVSVNGTPTMFVNGVRVNNPASFDSVSEQIENVLTGKTPG